MTTGSDTDTDTDLTEAAEEILAKADGPEFEFSTAVVPPIKFKIDDDMYEMRTVSHITPREEAKLRVFFRTETYINGQITLAISDRKHKLAMKHSEEQTELRWRIVEMMTNIPRPVLEEMRVEDEHELIGHIFRGFVDDGKDVGDILPPPGTDLAPVENPEDDGVGGIFDN